ncbi:hypothetical protein [Fulvimarina sp. MAC8]|uniref:hypothetical protein n=1 Tax=Fulvimarina sp. MAC8 TaxID=3162874 RepID=UPI0032EFA308
MPIDTIVARFEADDGSTRHFTFDELVHPIHDHRLIRDHSLLFWNSEFEVDSRILANIGDIIEQETGFPALSELTTLDRLKARDVPLDREQARHFVAGGILWYMPGFFTTIDPGKKHTSKNSHQLDQATAIHGALGRNLVKSALWRSYREVPRQRNDGDGRTLEKRAATDADRIISKALGYELVDQEDGTIGNERQLFHLLDGDRELGVLIETPTYILASAMEQGRRYIDWLYDISYHDEDGTLRRTVASDRLDRDGEKIRFYKACTKRINAEIALFEEVCGQEFDGPALAAWQMQVVTALRLAGSASALADHERMVVSQDLRRLNARCQALRQVEHPTPEEELNLENIRDEIANLTNRFEDHRRAPILREFENRRYRDAIYHILTPLNATLVAFYSGVDPQSINPDICELQMPAMAHLLEAAVWAGKLQRDRKRTMTAAIASTLLAVLEEKEWSAEHRATLLECRDIVFSALDPAAVETLHNAARNSARTGEPRTVFQGFPEINARQDLNRERMFDQALEDSEFVDTEAYGFAYDHDLGVFATDYRPLHLMGHFLNVPPAYEANWLGQVRIRFVDREFAGFEYGA